VAGAGGESGGGLGSPQNAVWLHGEHAETD